MARPQGATGGERAGHPGTEEGLGAGHQEQGQERAHLGAMRLHPGQNHRQKHRHLRTRRRPPTQCLPCEEAARSAVSHLRLHTLQL